MEKKVFWLRRLYNACVNLFSKLRQKVNPPELIEPESVETEPELVETVEIIPENFFKRFSLKEIEEALTSAVEDAEIPEEDFTEEDVENVAYNLYQILYGE